MSDGQISRRGFLDLLGGLTLAASPMGRIAGSAASHSSRLGIQLYTLRDLLAKDLEGTLAALRQIGYTEVEFAGLYGRPAGAVRAILDRVGLVAPGGHVGIPEITTTLDQTIADSKALGYQFVIVPWLPEESRTADGYRRVADTFNQAGEKLRAAGLTLGFHNHWFEFETLGPDTGICGYDLLLSETDANLVVMELDLFWIRKGGKDPLAYFRAHPGRFRMVHIKDMAGDGSMVDVGQGVIRWPEVLGAARKAGVRYFFAEHDEAKDPLAFARTTYQYLHSLRF